MSDGYFSNRIPEGTDEWLTPPHILQALGSFDVDPCSPVVRPWPTAALHYTIEDNGLSKDWQGRVWLNPPYGNKTESWLKRIAEHGNGIALIFARTETRMFFEHVWDKATAILFLKGRLFFCRVDGTPAKHNCGAPPCLVAYGESNAEALRNSGIEGMYVKLK